MFKPSTLRTLPKIVPEKYMPLQNCTSKKKSSKAPLHKKELSIQKSYKVIWFVSPHFSNLIQKGFAAAFLFRDLSASWGY